MPCVAFGVFCHRFRRAKRDNFTSAIAAFRADIYNPICGFDHVEIMFNHDHSIACLNQFMQYFQQLTHVLEMKPCCGLIKNIQGSSGRAPRQFLGQFHPLRLTSRQCRRLLADLNVTQSYTHQRIHFLSDAGHRLKKHLRIFNCHIKNIGYAFAFKLYF